jgi:hypothetical protein
VHGHTTLEHTGFFGAVERDPVRRNFRGCCRIRLPPFVDRLRRASGPRTRGADVTDYIIFFNQQWVGDHSEEWFRSRGPLARAAVGEMEDAGVLRYAGGLEEEIEKAFSADATSGSVVFSDGPYVESKEFLGGLTIVDVDSEDDARMWAGKIAEACGWPQEVRPFKPFGPQQ